MTFTDWLQHVETLLGYNLDAAFTIEALRHFRNGWSANDYATEIAEING
jgi:hypothetical protein